METDRRTEEKRQRIRQDDDGTAGRGCPAEETGTAKPSALPAVGLAGDENKR